MINIPIYCFSFTFPVRIQGQEHQEEKGQHRGVCGRGQGDAKEETEGKLPESKMTVFSWIQK